MPASISANGTVEAVKAVTNEQLVAMHQTILLTKDNLSIYIVGDVNVQEIKEKIAESFSICRSILKNIENEVEVTQSNYMKMNFYMKYKI